MTVKEEEQEAAGESIRIPSFRQPRVRSKEHLNQLLENDQTSTGQNGQLRKSSRQSQNACSVLFKTKPSESTTNHTFNKQTPQFPQLQANKQSVEKLKYANGANFNSEERSQQIRGLCDPAHEYLQTTDSANALDAGPNKALAATDNEIYL